MHTKFAPVLSLLLLACLLLGASAQSDCASPSDVWTNSTSPLSFTELDLTFPSTLNIKTEYYPSTSGNIDVDIIVCGGDTVDSPSILASLTANTDTIVLNVESSNRTSSVKPGTSGASRSAAPLTFVTLLISCFFLLPKNRLGLALLACVFCIALCTAADAPSVTVRVGVPSQITLICENGVCSKWGSSSSSSSASPSSSSDDVPPADPATKFFNIRALIMASHDLKSYGPTSNNIPTPIGADFAALAFESMGTPYDYLVVSAATDLSTLLSTAGTGQYSAIVTVGNTLLSDAQRDAVVAYQLHFGVKWAVIGSTGADLPGITMGSRVTNTEFSLTLAPEFSQFSRAINPAISVSNSYVINWSGYDGTPAKLYPGTITDATVATPAIVAQLASGPAVAAAAFKMPDGTQQLHYFVDQTVEYIHSMAFAPLLVDWISPAGLFIGARRLTFSVQPDDLFLGSFIWNTTTHTNPVGANDPWYRISAQDLQNLADFFDGLNARLPAGSYMTVEWPTNFGGINDYYTNYGQDPDLLWQKALELQNKFYYLSHTWDHPCTFDTLNVTDAYTAMNSEVSMNINYVPTFFEQNGQARWSNFSMITPCVTGLYNAGALEAMAANGITACVSDESVESNETDFEPISPYHGVYSTAEKNGYAGIFFVPREALDIDYCATNPEMVVDEYNTDNDDGVLDFEEIMAIQTMYAVQDKIGFRHDPFMLHQTNAASFEYADPKLGKTWTTSLVALFIQRVVDEMMSYFSLPIYIPQMDRLVEMFQQRGAMDTCGITTTLGVNDKGEVVQIAISSAQDCKMSLSGGAVLHGASVTMETFGPETTAWIQLDHTQPQTFTIPALSL